MVKTAATAQATPAARTESRLKSPSLRAYAALFLGALCIGFSAIFTKWANVPGPVSGFYRVGIATLVLALPYAAFAARRRAQGYHIISPEGAKHAWWLFGLSALAGLFFAGDLALWNTSLLYTSAANSTLLGNTSTLWVSLGAVFIFHQSLKRRFWPGMLLALAGAVVIVGRDFFIHPQLGLGDILAVVASLFYAAYLLNTREVRLQMDTLSFMWLSSLAATVLLFVFCLATGLQLTGFSINTWLSLIALAVISHVLGWTSINYALGHLPAPIAAVSLLSQPVFTAVLAVPLLGEPISLYQVAGGVLVLLGIYIVNSR